MGAAALALCWRMVTRSDTAFYREAGSGAAVVCLHANASSSTQWRALMDRLAPTFRVLAADGYGAGRSPPWPANKRVSLRDEVALLEPVFARAHAVWIKPLLLWAIPTAQRWR